LTPDEHEPSTFFKALQDGDAPPFEPVQLHDQDKPVNTKLGFASEYEQRLAELAGKLYNCFPFAAGKQTPSTFFKAVQVGEAMPSFRPLQVHVQGPSPDTKEGVPGLQRFAAGSA
jgi:hypothetical protein